MSVSESGHPRRWLILAVLSLNLVIVVAANSGLNVALPSLVREYGASHAQLQWIVDAYPLVFAPLLITAAAVGDRLGRKGVMQAGLALYAAANAVAALTHAPWLLAVLRGVMGVGGAMVMPATLSLLTSAFGPAQRPRAIAVWAGFAGAGAAIGPLASGLLLEHFHVASVFWVQVPLALVALGLGAVIVPTARAARARRLDVAGSLLSLVGIGLLVGAVIEAPERGWTDPVVLGGLGGAALFLGLFGRHQRRSPQPMLPLARLRDPGLSTGVTVIALLYFVTFGLFYVGTSYFQFVLGYGPLPAGAASLPLAVATLVGAPLGDRLADRLSRRVVVAVGLATVAAASLMFTLFDPRTPYPPIAAALAIFGLGMGLTTPSLTVAILRPFPEAEHGVGSAVNDLAREIGGSLGVAVMGSILAAGYRAAVPLPAQEWSEQAADRVRRSIGEALEVASHLSPDLGALLAAGARDAFLAGMRPALLTGAVILLLGAVLVLLRLGRDTDPAPASAARVAQPAGRTG
jgi:EmrB/QacA subfamily drug resistance transporter